MAASLTRAMVADAGAELIVCSARSANSRHASASIFLERWRLMISITLDFGLLRMRFVRFDDHLDEFVPDHVFLAEINELDSFNHRQHALGFDQAAALSRRQIYL